MGSGASRSPVVESESVTVKKCKVWFAQAQRAPPPSLDHVKSVIIRWVNIAGQNHERLGFCSLFYVITDENKNVLQAHTLHTHHSYEVAPITTKLVVDSSGEPKKEKLALTTLFSNPSFAVGLTLPESEHNDVSVKILATRVLALLGTSFKPVPFEFFHAGKPSHQWDKAVSELPIGILLNLFKKVKPILARESTLIHLCSPVYIFGDVHGSYKDLEFCVNCFGIRALGVDCNPASFLWLGDYVDRGFHSIEVVSHLFSLKILSPSKVFLLRGNHETTAVNGSSTFANSSLLFQCTQMYGAIAGKKLWKLINECFDLLPLAAVIDDCLFCAHAGIPRATQIQEKVLHIISAVPRPPPLEEDKQDFCAVGSIVTDLLWADPASRYEDSRMESSDQYFLPNQRGRGTFVFGDKLLKLFFASTKCTHLIRAHQIKTQMGLGLEKRGTVVTVFSSSYYCGGSNCGAVVLVCDSVLKTIIFDPTHTL